MDDSTDKPIKAEKAATKRKIGGPGVMTAMLAASIGSGQFTDAFHEGMDITRQRNADVAEAVLDIAAVQAKIPSIMKPGNIVHAIKNGASNTVFEKGMKEGEWNIKILSAVGAPVT